MAVTTLLRLGTAVLLVGCGALGGAEAAKQRAIPSATRVAFAQHGVAEGEDAVMHDPASSRKAASYLTPDVLSSAIARVMSLDGGASVEGGVDLPAGDIFNRPDGNVIVFVDGLRPQGSKSMPFITEWLQQPWYNLRTPTEDSWTSALESTLGTSFDVVRSVQSKSTVLCASVDPALVNSEACSSAEWIVTAEQASPVVWDNKAAFGPGIKSDASSGLRTLRFTGGEEGEDSKEIVLDLGVEADLLLAQELIFLQLLPKALEGRFGADANPPLVIVYLSSLKAIRTTYGETSAKGSSAFAALDASLSESFDQMSTNAGRRLTSQLVVGPHLREQLAHGGRRLQTENSTSSDGNVTLVDITQFQLNMWTGVFIAFIGFMAIYATATMDVQPDSLLYAKFITDTSGSGLKTD